MISSNPTFSIQEVEIDTWENIRNIILKIDPKAKNFWYHHEYGLTFQLSESKNSDLFKNIPEEAFEELYQHPRYQVPNEALSALSMELKSLNAAIKDVTEIDTYDTHIQFSIKFNDEFECIAEEVKEMIDKLLVKDLMRDGESEIDWGDNELYFNIPYYSPNVLTVVRQIKNSFAGSIISIDEGDGEEIEEFLSNRSNLILPAEANAREYISIKDLAIQVKKEFDLNGDICIENEINKSKKILISRTGGPGDDNYLVELEICTYYEDREEEYKNINNGSPDLESFEGIIKNYISAGGTKDSIIKCLKEWT